MVASAYAMEDGPIEEHCDGLASRLCVFCNFGEWRSRSPAHPGVNSEKD